VSTLPALEAVQAAKAQGWHASEMLDLALRRAFWEQNRCITMRHEILDIAESTGVLDVTELAKHLDSGSARSAVFAQYDSARDDKVICSPHVFLSDGTNAANPGVEAHWINGGFGEGFPAIDSDEPAIYEELLLHAAELAR
jgi:predicted DsbA family dithiol-disulfide isomerase